MSNIQETGRFTTQTSSDREGIPPISRAPAGATESGGEASDADLLWAFYNRPAHEMPGLEDILIKYGLSIEVELSTTEPTPLTLREFIGAILPIKRDSGLDQFMAKARARGLIKTQK